MPKPSSKITPKTKKIGSQAKKPTQTSKQENNGVDKRLYWITNISAVALPLSTLDQLWIIYYNKNASGVSAITWFMYGLLTLPLFFYALKRRDTPMIVLNGLWVVIDFTVWFGVLLYG